MSIEVWLAFLSIALVATITPGPAILLVVTHALQAGVGKALFTIAGNLSGLFLMSLCSVVGLSVLVLSSTFAFMVIKIVGAIYLIYMGVAVWRKGIVVKKTTSSLYDQSSPLKFYIQGILVSLTNPKAIAFTTALFPQFIAVDQPLFAQFSILVITFLTCSALCLASYAIWSRKLFNHSVNAASSTWISKIFGSTFIGAGIALAVSAQR